MDPKKEFEKLSEEEQDFLGGFARFAKEKGVPLDKVWWNMETNEYFVKWDN